MSMCSRSDAPVQSYMRAEAMRPTFFRFFRESYCRNQISMVLAETGSPRNMEAMEENFTEFSVVR